MLRSFRRSMPVVLLALAVGGSPAAADLLVLRDGTRIETRGAWREEGRRVVFTDAGGRLSALPAGEVDLDASRAATRARAESAESAGNAASNEAARPASIAGAARAAKAVDGAAAHRLTDADVGHLDPFDPASRDIVLYATSWCSVCRTSREFLTELGRSWIEYDVDEEPVAREEMLALTNGRWAVPTMVIAGEVHQGFSTSWIRTQLERMDAEERRVAEQEAAAEAERAATAADER